MKWEYKETEFDDLSISFIDYLNEEGLDRWELISHITIDDITYCLFKRPLP